MTNPVHRHDDDCATFLQDDHTCDRCGIYHGSRCALCGQRAYHLPSCPSLNDAPKPRPVSQLLPPLTRQERTAAEWPIARGFWTQERVLGYLALARQYWRMDLPPHDWGSIPMSRDHRQPSTFAQPGPRLPADPDTVRQEITDHDRRLADHGYGPLAHPSVSDNLAAIPAPGLATVNLVALRPLHMRKTTLSPREREMLVLVGRGFECPQIAAALWISHHTVRNHMKAALRHFGTRTAAGTVSAALVAGAISLDELRPGIAEPITLYPSGQGKAAHTLRGLLR